MNIWARLNILERVPVYSLPVPVLWLHWSLGVVDFPSFLISPLYLQQHFQNRLQNIWTWFEKMKPLFYWQLSCYSTTSSRAQWRVSYYSFFNAHEVPGIPMSPLTTLGPGQNATSIVYVWEQLIALRLWALTAQENPSITGVMGRRRYRARVKVRMKKMGFKPCTWWSLWEMWNPWLIRWRRKCSPGAEWALGVI